MIKVFKRTIAILIICLIFTIVSPFNFINTIYTVEAHSGRTDSRGGHHDYKNKSGLGSYHYHHGMGPHLHPGGVCPYSGSSNSSSLSKSYKKPSPSISITNYPRTLNVGDSSGFEYSVSNATNNDSSVVSSDTNVVKVGRDNILRAVGAGTAQITIEASGTTKTFTVKVVAVPVEEVIISNIIDKIQLGEDYKFETVVLPENATNKKITWISDNTDILEISDTGNIKTKSSGIVTITALADNNIENKITIEIFEIVPETIECEDAINLFVGEKEEYSINILPDNTNNKDFQVICDDENILKYSESSIEGISDGKTTLHIETWNGITKDIPVTVNIVPVENVNIIDKTNYLVSNIIDKNDDISLKAEVAPSNATYQNIEWESSDDSVVMIDNNNFNIVGTGNVTLTCYAHGNITNSITINIIDTIFIGCVICIILLLCIIIVLVRIRNKAALKKKTISDSKNSDIIDSKPIIQGNKNEYKLQNQISDKKRQETKEVIMKVKEDF